MQHRPQCTVELSFTPVKINVQKLNPAKSGVDFQQLVRPHHPPGHLSVIINSLDLNILIGGRKMLPSFSIGEWLVCPKCGVTCDAPFHPAGGKEEEPELVLGSFLPDSSRMSGEQQIEVTASCPRCAHQLRAIATFRNGCLREFRSLEEPIQQPQQQRPCSHLDR